MSDYLGPEDNPGEWGDLTPEELAAVEADKARGLTEMYAPGGQIAVYRSPERPPVELWLRNPHRYSDVITANPFPRFVYAKSQLQRMNLVTPYRLLLKWLPSTEWEFLIVAPDHALRFTRTDSAPVDGQVYPVERIPCWRMDDGLEALVRMCRAYERFNWSRIVVGWPQNRSGRRTPTGVERAEADRTLEAVHGIAEAFPHVRLHLYAHRQYRKMFGLNFAAADFDPADIWDRYGDQVILPTGRRITVKDGMKHLKWLHVLGYSLLDLKGDTDRAKDNRLRFNIHSALWAAEHFNDPKALKPTVGRDRIDPYGLLPPKDAIRSTELVKTRQPSVKEAHDVEARTDYTRLDFDPDTQPQMVRGDIRSGQPVEPYAVAFPISNRPGVPVSPRRIQTTDKIVCDACSLADKCRYYRHGGVCIVPSSDMGALARLFGSRDAETVREGLQKVLEAQATRHAKLSAAWDKTIPELQETHTDDVVKQSKHLMEVENSLMRGAEALIKILDPKQRIPASGIPAINANTTVVLNPATLVADVVKQLEAAGVERSAIDPARILDVLAEKQALPVGIHRESE